MSKFILFIIIVNLIVVIYNLYMWFKVGIENESLKKENEELRYYLNLEYKHGYLISKELTDIKIKKD